MGELQLAALLCALLSGGDAEDRKYFDVNEKPRYVRVDCETDTHVIELGLDGTASSRDSLHQAMFAADLTGKIPVVVLIDQDGFEGRYEYEMRRVARAAGVAFGRCNKAMILRWAATTPWRQAASGFHDLPSHGPARAVCDLNMLQPGSLASSG